MRRSRSPAAYVEREVPLRVVRVDRDDTPLHGVRALRQLLQPDLQLRRLALRYLGDTWGARRFATLDPEEFYDFTSLRPEVRLRDDRSREIVWPTNRFLAASTSGPHDVVIMVGIEPHLRWRAFSDCLTTVAKLLQVQAVFTLGVMLAEVAHTRAAPVRGSSADPTLARRLGIAPHTVEWHVSHLIEKLQVHSKLQAVIAAARAGLIEL